MMEERSAGEGWGDGLSIAFVRAYERGELLPLKDLNSGFARPESAAQLRTSYYQAGWLCDVLLREFGDSSWNMQLRIWLPSTRRYYSVQSEINIAIVRKFREYDIEIPFPQRDLHVRSPLPVPLETSSKSDNGD